MNKKISNRVHLNVEQLESREVPSQATLDGGLW